MKKDPRLQFLLPMVGCCLLFLGAQVVVDLIFAVIFSMGLASSAGSAAELDALLYEKLMEQSNLLGIFSYGLVFLGLLIWAKKRKQPMIEFTGLQVKSGFAVGTLALLAGVFANFWFGLMLNLIPWPQAWLESYEAASSALSGGSLAVEILTVVILAPVVEEVIFRGLIYRYLTYMVPVGAAVVLQGVLFGGMHGTMIWAIYASVLGCVLGYVRRRTGSVRATILMHMGFNGGSFLFAWFAQQWGENGTAVLGTLAGTAALFLLMLYGIDYRTRDNEEKAA